MIRLIGATKTYGRGADRKVILDDVTLDLPRRNIAILAKNGAGKSTLLRMIAGTEPLTRGRIVREVAVSWPLGFSGGFNATTTGIDNTRFISRIYGQDTDSVVGFVREFSELGRSFEMPVGTYSTGMRARLAFAISMAVQFDCYLVDEITEVGDDNFREKCRFTFKERLKSARIVMVSHGAPTLRLFCDMAAVVHQGGIELYDDLEEGLAAHQEILRFSATQDES
jgi:capsular polysaccharide transport system ATP-binding protein